MSAPKNTVDRPALVALLERFNLSVESFDALRAEAYEQQLARHSLEHLELLYQVLLTPGMTTEQQRAECPPWPPGTKLAGRLPAASTLGDIATRLRTEQTLNNLGRVSTFMDKVRSRMGTLPTGQQTDVLDTLVGLVGEEMLASKLGGGLVSANLDPLDRLFKRKQIDQKDQAQEFKKARFAEAKKDEAARALEFCLEEAKKYPEVQELFKTAFAALKKAKAK